MANNKVKHYRTKVAGRRPDPAKLEEGEIAINMTDKKIFTKMGTSIVNLSNGADSVVDGGQTFKGEVKAEKIASDGDVVLKNAVDSKISFTDEFGKEKASIKAPAQTDGSGALEITVQNGSATTVKNTVKVNGDGTVDLPSAPVKSSSATRKDYVDAGIKTVADNLTKTETSLNTKIDANKKEAADNLDAVETELNTRIDSIGDKNSELAKNKVNKTGDTMSGDLRITTAGDTRLRLKNVEFRSNAVNSLIVSTPEQPIHIRPKGNDVPDQQFVIEPNGDATADRVLVRSVQDSRPGALTRKDYVDGQIKPVSDKAAAADAKATDALGKIDAAVSGKVNKAGDTMNGKLIASKGVTMGEIDWLDGGLIPGNRDGATWENCNIDLSSWYGIGISSPQTKGVRSIVINARSGDITSKGTLSTSVMVESEKMRVGASGIRRKTNDSALIAGDGNIGLEFATGEHASGFKNGYLLEQIKGFLDTKLTKAIQLDKRNLNDIMTVGLYEQHANANTPGLNYPENLAGSLTVTAGAGVQQTYHVYNTPRVWRRAKYSTDAWTPWTRAFNYGDGALAIGYAGTSGLGNNSLAIGDNDTGFRQVGDGILEVVANSQRVGQFTNVHAYFDKPLNIVGNTNVRDNGSFTFVKAGANPRNIRMFHSGDASRGGRLEIAGESSYIVYFEERPDNSHMTSINSNLTVGGSASFGAQVSVNANGPGFRLNATAATQSCYLLGQRVGANAFYIGMGGTDTTATFHNYQTGTTMQLRPSDVYFNKLAYGAADANFNNVYIRSDKRLKGNFSPIENALEKVNKLSGLIYDKKHSIDGEYESREAGIIAQELKAVLPEAVGEHDGILNVSSAGVNALLINAIKELTARIQKLEGEK
ncbi:tail fiber domain-containing protein [Enterobacter hormaechei subsp. xiangfangensis]|nr:tail fiber domain-containing protein [Enterobacter hormaechei subsp. xiangfangensis]